ncbi:MAG: serine peptidase, partial [Comamonadaceae bacterium]
MFHMDWKKVRSYAVAMALAVTATVALMPAKPVVAQSAPQPRSLPDFTELVDAVGPAVVNIRTTERVRQAAGPG